MRTRPQSTSTTCEKREATALRLGALQEIYGKPAQKMVKLLKKTQDDLGDHQDLIVAPGLMEELGVAGDRPPQAASLDGLDGRGYGREASEILGRLSRIRASEL